MVFFGNVTIGGICLVVFDYGQYIKNSLNQMESNKCLVLCFSILSRIDQSSVLQDMRLAALDSKVTYTELGPMLYPDIDNGPNLDGSRKILRGGSRIGLHESITSLIEINSEVSLSVFQRIRWKVEWTKFIIVVFTVRDNLLSVLEANLYYHIDGPEDLLSKEILMINYNDINHFRGMKGQNECVTVSTLRQMLDNLNKVGCRINHFNCQVSNLPVSQSYNVGTDTPSDYESLEAQFNLADIKVLNLWVF
jgi:hypothetical protein